MTGFHLDVDVEDVETAGARRLDGGCDFRIYTDPAGHPFCLVW